MPETKQTQFSCVYLIEFVSQKRFNSQYGHSQFTLFTNGIYTSVTSHKLERELDFVECITCTWAFILSWNTTLKKNNVKERDGVSHAGLAKWLGW